MTGTAPPTVEESFAWFWAGEAMSCPLTRRGDGPRAVLLLALSSISTRHEMEPLQACLAERFETIAPDWPGFGTNGKPRVDWTPMAMAGTAAHNDGPSSRLAAPGSRRGRHAHRRASAHLSRHDATQRDHAGAGARELICQEHSQRRTVS